MLTQQQVDKNPELDTLREKNETLQVKHGFVFWCVVNGIYTYLISGI